MNPILAMLRQEDHISVSAVSTYLKCPNQYYLNYIKKIPITFKPASLAFGDAIHKALAYFYLTLKNKKNPGKKFQEEFVDVFIRSWVELNNLEVPVIFEEKDTFESLQEKGVKMLNVFFKEIERPYKVVAVEEAFSVEFAELLPLTNKRFVGALDAVVQNKDGSYTILEHKTSARRYSTIRLNHDMQVTAYYLIANMIGITPIRSVKFQVLLKTKNAELETYSMQRKENDFKEFFRIVGGVLSSVNAKAFYPVRDWYCEQCFFQDCSKYF